MKHSAGIILVKDSRSIFLLHRDEKPNISYAGYWSIPGGGVRKNEAPEEAARRELLEETGYRVDKVNFLGREIYRNDKREKICRHIFWAEYDKRQKVYCYEGKEGKFVSSSVFSRLKIIPGQKKFFLKALGLINKGKKISSTF